MKPTNLFIDCEFNGMGGALLSMALVDEAGTEWYEVTLQNEKRDEEMDPWVEENVIPVLNKPNISYLEFQASLAKFLNTYQACHIIADFPDDIKHFCECLLTGPGTRLDTPPLTMEIRRDIGARGSVIPHNALSDAKAIRRSWLDLPAVRRT